MVFQEADDGAGHPGHDKCRSWIEDHKVVTESNSGVWKWSWEFFDDHALLQVLSADTDRAYWFLYEGTPGGRFEPENTYFGTSISGPEPLTFDYDKGDIYRGAFQWIYTGNILANRTFYIVHCQKDTLPDMVSLLGNTAEGLDSPEGMTVFGFGRGEGVTRYLEGRQGFVIGIYPKNIEDPTDHLEISEFFRKTFSISQ
jgi:hypothetical protein